ncbi:hypothetical protein FI667_g15179, partial [Globisporangium splendens]
MRPTRPQSCSSYHRPTPPSVPLSFRRQSFSNGRSEVVDAGETSPTTRSEILEGSLVAKAAWCTPRSPTTSHLEAFFAASSSSREELDGTAALSTTMPRNRHEEEAGPMLATPARLQSVEESLRATDERYRIDLDAPLADNQKFLNITTTANQHLESIHDELPQISTTYDKTTSALVDLSKDIATLYEQQELLKGKMLEQLDQVFNQGTDEKLALVEAHEAEKALLHDAHTQELQDLDVQYRAQLEALEQKCSDMETTCLKEIRELQASSAMELAATQDQAATELAQLKEPSHAEKDAMEDALQLQNKFMRDHEAALEALKTTYGEQLQTVKQDQEALVRDFEAELALADTTARVLVQEHKDEVAAMESAHATQLEARMKEAETATALLKQECDDKIRALTEELQRDAELSRLRVAEEHPRKLEQVVENARVNEQQQRRALDDVQAAFAEETQRLDAATQQLTLCEDQIGELQRKVETSEQELRDAKQLVIARTSTIDSLHKELHEATEVTSSEVSAEECLTRLRQQLDAHLWTRYRLDRAQISGLMYSTEADALECLQQFVRIRCARLTHDDEEEKGEGDEKKNETHLDTALVLSVDDVCKRVRDYDDLYATKTDYDTVASTHHELFENDSWSRVNEKVSTEVTQILTEFNQSTQRIEELFHLDPSSDGSAKSRHTASSLMPKLENCAALLAKLGLIDDENPHARAGQILEILAQHDALLQHVATMWNAETLQLTNLQDVGALLTQVHDVLGFSRGAVESGLGEYNTIADLKVLVAELTHLWMTYDTYTAMHDAKPSHLEPHAGDSDSTMDSHVPVAAKSAEILRFVDNTTRFIADCQAMLHLNPSSRQALSLDPSTCSTGEILQCIQELMTVLDHFDAFQSLPMASINSGGVGDTSAHFLTADNGSALASIQRKVGIVRTFLDELHLMTDFAQSILDEESDAAASTDALGNTSTTTSNSNSSSRESLQGFRALTRTPTPMSMDLDGDNEDDVRPTNLEINVPRPLNELELELLQQDDAHGVDVIVSDFAALSESKNDDSDASSPRTSSRIAIFEQLLDERQRLATKSSDIDANMSLEAAFLVAHGLLSALAGDSTALEPPDEQTGHGRVEPRQQLSTQTRIQIYTQLLQRLGEQTTAHQQLEMANKDVRLALEEQQQSSCEPCVSNENAFPQAHSVVLSLPLGEIGDDANDTTTLVVDRIPVYEHFVAAIARLEAIQQQARDELTAEQRVLERYGLLCASKDAEKTEVTAEVTASDNTTTTDSEEQGVFDATSPPSVAAPLPVTLSTPEKALLATHSMELDAGNATSSRMDVYKTLLDGQNALIDEKMECEVDLERENAFLARNGLPVADRMALFDDMVGLRLELDARDEMDAMEQSFLKEHGLWMPEADEKEEEGTTIGTKMDPQERFGMRFRAFTELIEARAMQEQERQFRQATIEAEKAYLAQQTSVNLGDAIDLEVPGFSRLRVFEALVDAHEAARAAWGTQNSHAMAHFPDHETHFLMKNGLQVSTLQNQELEAQRERCETLLMVSNEVPLVALHHVKRLARENEQLQSELTEREAQLVEQLDQCKQDQALAVKTHATELAMLQSTHDVGLAKVQSTHDDTLARLHTTHTDALASLDAQRKQGLTAALAKQAKQLEIAALVRAEEESHQHQFNHTRSAGQSGISPTQARALLLDKFTKRDTAAISMIYRSIRLATDILNTSALVSGGSTASGLATSMTTAHASEISVEVTQSVLNCVKELKALKEYLIESLEQLTRSDDVFPSQPPAFVKLNIADALTSSASSAEDQRDKNEAAIDFALCSHREFMNYAHLQLLMREEAMHTTFAKLMNSLQGVARGDEGDSNNSNSTGSEAFTVSQQKLMRLEVDVVRESETRQNLDCKFHLNETYYHQLLDERKELEVTLNNALADLRAECKSLRAKVDALEHERYTAPPPSSALSAGLYGLMSSLSPRATPVMSVSNFGFPVTSMRPEKPRDGSSSKPGGSIHKDGAAHNAMSARRIHEWKKQDELLQLSSSSHLEHEFRALQATASTATSLVHVAEAPASLTLTRGGGTATGPRGGVGPNPHDQELWYQGVCSVQYISFFVSVFHVTKQNLFRVEVSNSDTEQQQAIYVTWSELEVFLSESKKARNLGLSLHDATKRSEIADVLFERVRVHGEGTANILLGFE